MELKEELNQLRDSIESATQQIQGQLNNIGHIMLPVSLVSLGGAIGLQAVFNILLFWVPTSFILWVAYCIWSGFDQLGKYFISNKDAVFRQYGKLSNKRKTVGVETFAKRLIPLSQAGAAIYFISTIILVLAKAGIINSPENFPVWTPLAVNVLLILLLLGGPILYRHLRVSDIDVAVNLYRNRTKLVSFVQSHLILVAGALLILFTLILFIYFGLPLWSLITTWGLYHSNANIYIVLILLVMQVLSFVLLSGYLTQMSARTELSNNVANLSNINLRVNQLLSLGHIPADEIFILKRQYYSAIKYRFIQERVFGFIPVYIPVLNEAYAKSDTK